MTERASAVSTFGQIVAAAILGGCVAFGLMSMGREARAALRESRSGQRYVTVKGLAEREMPADLAIWPVMFSESADDLSSLQQKIDQDQAIVHSFFKKVHFADSAGGETETNDSAPAITDTFAQGGYQQGNHPRYSAQVTVTLRTRRVAELDKTVRTAGELVRQGVVLQGGYGGNGVQYFFTKLNEVKPQMIAEATQNARKAAEQFARDSKSRVGSIRNASQGLFSVEDRDQYTPQLKKVRVVTTVDYFLADD